MTRETFSYPAVLEPGESPGVTVVTFPDVPEAITEGEGEADARAMGRDALGVALLTYLDEGRPLPQASAPREGQVVITVNEKLSAEIRAHLARS